MKQQWVSRKSTKRLILMFAGWGMDAGIFADIRREGYDVMVVYDYTEGAFDTTLLSGYEEIAVIGWSMGVYFADKFIAECRALPITKCVAVNGTLEPVSETFGIPPAIYDKTSLLPDSGAVDKFYRRICGGRSGQQRLMSRLPERDVDGLRRELIAIREATAESRLGGVSHWDEIVLSANDLIFPIANMKAAWGEVENRVTIVGNGAHMIDFGELVERMFIDKALVSDKFAAASETYLTEAQVQMQVARNLLAYSAEAFPTTGKRVLEIGSGCGNLTRMYQPHLSDSHLTLWDLSPTPVGAVNGNRVEEEVCDAETSILRLAPESVDMVISSSTIQWFNSPRRFIDEIMRVLKPGGGAYLAFYVKGTFCEMGDFAGLRYPEISAEDIEREGCRIAMKEERLTMEFANPLEALRHIRLTGVNSLRREPMGVASTRAVIERLRRPDGGTKLTFVVKYLKINKNG